MENIWSVDPSARHNKSRHHHQCVLLEVFSCEDKNKQPFQTKTTLTTSAWPAFDFKNNCFNYKLDKSQHMNSNTK